MRRKIMQFVSVLIIVFLLTGCGECNEVELATEFVNSRYDIATTADNKVILDCDMTYLGDDAMCMSILTQADALCWIDLLGITITGGNTVVASGANAALIQLEKTGRTDIPVYMGTDVPLNGFRDMEKQAEIVGEIDHWGVMFQLDSLSDNCSPGCGRASGLKQSGL